MAKSKIEVHIFKKNKKYFLIDVNSNQVYKLKRLAYIVMKSLYYEGYKKTEIVQKLSVSKNKISQVFKEILFLENKLLKQTPIDFSLINYASSIRDFQPGGLILILSQKCNLKCKYCYYNNNKRQEQKMMRNRVAWKAIDFLLQKSHKVNQYEVYFFGGEPLLNWKTMEDVITYCESKGKSEGKQFLYGMTTNGTLLPREVIEIISSYSFTIMVSLDGPEEIHNRFRTFLNGKGSFNKVISNLRILLKVKKRNPDLWLSIRATITRHTCNTISIKKLLNFFAQFPIYKLYLADVSNYSGQLTSYELTPKETQWMRGQIFALKKNIVFKMVNGKDTPYNPFFEYLRRIHNETKDIISCGICKGMTTVDADGSLYPCHRFVGLENCKIGDIYNGIDTKSWNYFWERLEEATLKCHKCWARFICARSCARDYFLDNGEITERPDWECNMIKNNIEEIIHLYAMIKKKYPSFLSKLNMDKATSSSTEESIPKESAEEVTS